MTKLEEVGLAIITANGCGLTIDGERAFCDDPRTDHPQKCECRLAARAAIEAMREPSEAMLAAGDYVALDGDVSKKMWRAMIDAALGELPEVE